MCNNNEKLQSKSKNSNRVEMYIATPGWEKRNLSVEESSGVLIISGGSSPKHKAVKYGTTLNYKAVVDDKLVYSVIDGPFIIRIDIRGFEIAHVDYEEGLLFIKLVSAGTDQIVILNRNRC